MTSFLPHAGSVCSRRQYHQLDVFTDLILSRIQLSSAVFEQGLTALGFLSEDLYRECMEMCH